MLIIGERINSSRKSIELAIAKKDEAFLIEQARIQLEAGATFIDVNCAVFLEKEEETLLWLIKIIQGNFSAPICIDSPDPEVIKAALEIHKGKPFINSITAEDKKLKAMQGVLKSKDAFVVALTMDEGGIPEAMQDRIKIAEYLADTLKKNTSFDVSNMYVDPLVKPISSEPYEAKKFLDCVKQLKAKGIKTVGGLSNVSYGLPQRRILNSVFISLALDAGIDALIIDPTYRTLKLPQEIYDLAKAALLGEDPYCSNYIKAFRQGMLKI